MLACSLWLYILHTGMPGVLLLVLVHNAVEPSPDRSTAEPHLEGFPPLGRACDVHDGSSTQHIVGVPNLDAIIAHHLSVLKGNLLHLAPVTTDEQGVSHIIRVHHEQEDDALIHVAQGVAEDEDEGQDDG